MLQYFVNLFNRDIISSLPRLGRSPFIEGNWYNGWDLLLRVVFWGSETPRFRPSIFPQRPIEIPLDEDNDWIWDVAETLDNEEGNQSDYATDGDVGDVEDEEDKEILVGNTDLLDGARHPDDSVEAQYHEDIGHPGHGGSWLQGDHGDDEMEAAPLRTRKRSGSSGDRNVRQRTSYRSGSSEGKGDVDAASDKSTDFSSSEPQGASGNEHQRGKTAKKVKTTCRIPDFVGELIGLNLLFLIVENKALPEEDTRTNLIDKFTEALDQSYEQAEFAFASDHRMKLLAAILAVGDFWTYLEYERDKMVPLPRDENDYNPVNEGLLDLDKTKRLEAGNHHVFLESSFGDKKWITRCNQNGLTSETRAAFTAIVEHLKDVHKGALN